MEAGPAPRPAPRRAGAASASRPDTGINASLAFEEACFSTVPTLSRMPGFAETAAVEIKAAGGYSNRGSKGRIYGVSLFCASACTRNGAEISACVRALFTFISFSCKSY